MRWALVVALLFAAACYQNANDCQSSAECGAGKVCMRIAPERGAASQTCVVRCDPNDQDGCGGGDCICADSASGARCQVVEESNPGPTFYCVVNTL